MKSTVLAILDPFDSNQFMFSNQPLSKAVPRPFPSCYTIECLSFSFHLQFLNTGHVLLPVPLLVVFPLGHLWASISSLKIGLVMRVPTLKDCQNYNKEVVTRQAR